VPGIYQSLLTEHHVDLLLGGYGNNSISPAMPVAIEHGKFFVGLMGLGVNNSYQYDRFFAMIPTGPDPSAALTEGFFETAARQAPQPVTVAVVAADADFTKNPIAGARANAAQYGMHVVSETKYPLATSDFAAVLREAEAAQPDILFLCSYLVPLLVSGRLRRAHPRHRRVRHRRQAGRRRDDRPAKQHRPS